MQPAQLSGNSGSGEVEWGHLAGFHAAGRVGSFRVNKTAPSLNKPSPQQAFPQQALPQQGLGAMRSLIIAVALLFAGFCTTLRKPCAVGTIRRGWPGVCGPAAAPITLDDGSSERIRLPAPPIP